ncbi:hypothetical protein F4677DRAFT_351426 [Hypoxylon crocopeplum]|nr:hypothetical protein F4677DRAFT_351426 [Hypoxylon crocopeplum]
MASSHDWQGYGNPLPGPGGGEIPLNNFDDFQQYAHPQSSQPYEGADSGNHFFGSTSFPNYPPIQSGGYFGANSFSGNNLPDQQSHFSGTHGYENVDSGGGGVHGHGAPSHQSYRGPGFNTHPGYGTLPQSEFNTGYEAEQQTQAQQQAQAHDHAPSAFGTQAWQAQSQQLLAQQVPTQQTPSQQVPPQQATANFAQRTIGYETHSPSPMYQQRQQIGPYPGAPIGQRGISFGSSGANGYYGAQSPQVPTPQYGDQGRDSAGVGGYQTSINPPPARPAEPVALNSLEVSQSGQFQPLKEQNKDDGAAWVLPEGSPNLFAKNPPKTKIGNFAAVIAGIAKKRPTKQDGTKHLPPGNPLLPRRSCRLPSEIQAERTWLEGLLENATTSTSRNAIQQRLTRLDNEQVIIADLEGSKPIPRVSKASRVKVPKHKSPAMDSTRKSRSSESEDDDDISLNGVARQIMSNPRPQVALEAVKYDVIKVLWRDPKLPEPSTQAVGDNIHAFGNYVTDLWTKSKDLKSDVEKAQNEKDEAKLQSLRAALDSTYTSIQVAIEAAIKFGDNYTLTQLGTHKKLFGSFCILLRNRFAAKDYNGPMPKAILKLMSLAVTVNTAFLTTKAKLDPVRQKYNSNLDEEARDYMDLIFDNAKKRSALEAETSREDAKKGDDVKKAIPGGPKKTSTTSTRDVQPTPKLLPPKKNVPLKANAEIKKMQPINYSGLGSARKISNVAKANSSSTSSKRPSDEDVDLRAPKKAAVENGTGVPSAPKTTSTAPATAQAPSAPSAQARSRPTGSMLPGRSRVSVMQPKKPAPQAASAPPAPQQTSNSLIGDLLAQIAAPKEEAKAPKEPERPPETPEETARRLRKESRRHLRVSWKPNDELTSIRTFEHDTTEDEGRDDSMLRDARDNRSEGRMFKQDAQGCQMELWPYATPS